jgi:hypothetical protein
MITHLTRLHQREPFDRDLIAQVHAVERASPLDRLLHRFSLQPSIRRKNAGRRVFGAWILVCALVGCQSRRACDLQSTEREMISPSDSVFFRRPVTSRQAAEIALGYVHGQGTARSLVLDSARITDHGAHWRVEFSLSANNVVPPYVIVAVDKATGVPRWMPVM